jgi:single-stranded DNA-binding protein
MRRHERQRRNELQNIATMGDLNELSISGHVEHQPELGEDHHGEQVCEFVLTHHAVSCGIWMLERYTVEAYGQLGQNYATNWQPGQAIIVDGRLEYRDCDTLAGPLASITIIAHHIATLGPHPHTSPHQQTIQ